VVAPDGPREERSPRRKFALAILICMGILAAVPAALAVTAATAVVRGGAFTVAVDETGPGGDSVHLVLPTALLDLGLAVAPDRVFREIGREIERSGAGVELTGLRAIADELRDLPDAVLVEIHDGRSVVLVESVDGRIRVRVDDGDTHVRLDVPARTLTRVLDRIAASA
jgi:hypothetical protein